MHGGLHPGSNTPAFRRGARPLPVVDVAGQDEIDRVFEKDGLERAREVGGLFKLRALGKVGVERAEEGFFCLGFGRGFFVKDGFVEIERERTLAMREGGDDGVRAGGFLPLVELAFFFGGGGRKEKLFTGG